MLEMVGERISQPACEQGFILDGIPRTRNQAVCLDKCLAQIRWVMPVSVAILHLTVSESVILQRLLSRRLCPSCGRIYGPDDQNPRIAGVCDRDGDRLLTRADDHQSTVEKRLQVYHN